MLKDEGTVFAVNYNGYDWLVETHSAGKRKITRISSPLFLQVSTVFTNETDVQAVSKKDS